LVTKKTNRFGRALPWLLGSLGVGALSFGLIGFAHTPAGMRAWGRLTGASCPFPTASKNPTPAELDRAYAQAAQRVRGSTDSKTQFALGFSLLHTRRADVAAWAVEHRAECTDQPDGLGMICELADVAQLSHSGSSSGSATLLLRFDVAHTLRSITASQQVQAADAALAAVTKIRDNLEALAGPPEKTRGTFSLTYLTQGALSQVGAEYHFKDYAAEFSATDMGRLGYVHVSQTYTSLAD
jgi:hypothetical protein